MTHTLHLGDCRDVLATMDDCSVDAIVCDPPYELGFMGKSWDASGIAYDVTVWAHCLRVLKPGGHLIAFGGSRTYHRLAVAIEDAGFEIRDQIQWIYGSGFPKSLDVSKAMDKQRHDRAQTLQVTAWIRSARDAVGLSNAQIDAAFGFAGMAGHWTSSLSQPSVPTLDQIPVLLDLFGMTLDDVPDEMRTLIWTLNGRKGQPGEAWHRRDVVGTGKGIISNGGGRYNWHAEGTEGKGGDYAITAPSTDLAKRWHGWGTALKPAHEPAVLARKPLRGTVADNVTAWGVGALNIEGTRVGTEGGCKHVPGTGGFDAGSVNAFGGHLNSARSPASDGLGRWPSNVILDEEAAQVLDGQSGERKSGGGNKGGRNETAFFGSGSQYDAFYESSAGGASRFFYVAKASKAEREAGLDGMEAVKRSDGRKTEHHVPNLRTTERANHHPTVKPLALMRYLVRMVTPPGGVVLDPFMGSGSTGCAAVREGFDFVGIDLTPEYVAIAQKRIDWHAVTSPLDNIATMELHEENDA